MIRIACTNCKTILTIDDAFAGGVCRCQHCGTIQTVPAQARESSATYAAGQSMGGGKLLYQNDARSGTGLDELAGIVVSSGLQSSRLRQKPSSASKNKNNLPLFIGGGAVILVLLVVIIFLALRSGSPPPVTGDNIQNTTGTGTNPTGPHLPVAAVPNFCGTKIEGSTVAYLLDCGAATQEYLGDLKDACIRSIDTLGSDHKFQILFWTNNDQTLAYPDGSATYATKDSIESAQKAIQDQPASGATDILPALRIAMEQHPDVIVIATGKGWDLDANWVADVLKIRDKSAVRFDTFNLGSSESAPLKALAAKTGGSYRTLSKSDLRPE